ncbi:MAG: adenosylcobinamide-GDP ribazoletransferase [Rhodobiaceae bacterium]|nr:adenosylcobinamide-GDP ribazoletransferase [Rhodobiaceae bacterium]
MQTTVNSLLGEARRAILFYTRLPASWLGAPEDAPGKGGEAGMGTAIRMAPVAGLAVGLAGAVVLAFATALTGSALAGAVFALAATVLVSGALHEDGLADFADSLGGASREQRLEIMRDSRIGTYGALALVLSVAARAALIAAIGANGGPAAAMLTLISAHAVSRAMALWLPYSLPPARATGAGAAFGRPDEPVLQQAVLISLVIAFVLAASGAGLVATLGAVVLCAATAFAMGLLCEHKFGGQTGDLSGATVQLCEIAFLLAVAALI